MAKSKDKWPKQNISPLKKIDNINKIMNDYYKIKKKETNDQSREMTKPRSIRNHDLDGNQ